MKNKLLLLLANLCLLISPAFAQDGFPPSALTWADCVSIALNHNPDLASSQYSREASKSSYRGSFNNFMPQVNLSHSYNDSSGSGPPTWQAQATARLNIFDMSQISDIQISAALLTQAEASLWQISSTLRFNLRRAYAQLLFAQNNVEVSQRIRKMRQQSAQLVTLRYESGRESKGNMLRAKAQGLQAEADLSQAFRDLRAAQKSLDRQMGMDDFAAVVATGTFNEWQVPDLPQDERALTLRRPDIALQNAAVKVAEASLEQAKSSLWPTLSANYSRFVTDTKEFPSNNSGWNFSGVVSLPIFSGGPTATYFAVSAAKKNLERFKQDLRASQGDAIVDIETSWSDFAGAVDQSKVQAALLEAARQRNDEADVRYASGLLTYDNWEIIASDRVNQERQAIQSQLNTLTTEAGWEKSLGKRLEE